MRRFHYTEQDIVKCLRQLGVNEGDILFSHISLLPLGFISGDITTQFISALKTVLGDTGSFLTPTYSYTFCQGKKFDINQTHSQVGAFGQALIEKHQFSRSCDPNFSVTGFGPNISSLFKDLPRTSFGENCLYQRLEEKKAKICNFGLTLSHLTPIHYIEKEMKVPYRFDKIFSGNIINGNSKDYQEWTYFVRYMTSKSEPDCSRLQQAGEELQLVKKAKLGLGEVTICSMNEYFNLARMKIQDNPWLLVNGPPFQPTSIME